MKNNNNKSNNVSRAVTGARALAAISAAVPRGLRAPSSIFPTRRNQRFTYNAAGYLNIGTNAYSSTEFFNATGVYDPDYSNFTRNSSALGFSFYMGTSQGQYANYLVSRCHVKFVFSAVTAATTNLCVSLTDYLGVGSDYASTSGNTATQISQRRTSALATMANTNSSADPITIEFDVIPWRVIGITREAYLTDSRYWGSYAGNPSNVGAFVAITISDYLETGVNATASVGYTVEMSFDVALFGVQYV